ncbi:hypothetical protein EYV94_07165 [Puteibacter caeruleilacunae]|nr:hypothetical protein EYV94_07165 [Puteibacter caeruleilacunae]
MERIDNNYNQNDQGQMPLPNANLILSMGVLSLVLLLCFQTVAAVIAIITFILAYKETQAYQSNPGVYTAKSFQQVNSGKLCAIVTLAISIIIAVAAALGILHFFHHFPHFDIFHDYIWW